VSRADVERIVRRDFPDIDAALVHALLDEYGTESWELERARVQLAALKLAGGDLAALRRHVDVAKIDYRDVLAAAEYPAAIRHSSVSGMPDPERQQIYDADWQQYEQWLTRR
jgi:hypothetical protein